MGIKPTFQDLQETYPVLAKGLKNLLDYTGDDIEEVFGVNFQISYSVFGEQKTHLLIAGGADINVTKQNRDEYVRLYTKFLLEDYIQKQFAEFLKGFQMVCMTPVFKLFVPEEVQLLICGSPVFNFEDLQKTTLYDNGYTATHPVIKNFWEVVHSLSLEEKKKLLFFSTGSDRAPIGGLANLNFVITRHGSDSDRLPQAHTCFNHLLLPEYSTKEKLRDRLMAAINNAEGFGML